MKIVIAGARLRNEPSDYELVNALIDGLKSRYSDLKILASPCDKGIGKIVKNRLLKNVRTSKDIPEGGITWVDFQIKIFGPSLPKAAYAEAYDSRNHAMAAWGEEFHIFLDRDRRGTTRNLLELVQERGLPHSIYILGVDTVPKFFH